MTKNGATANTIINTDTLTININTTVISYKWLCLKVENLAYLGSSVISADFMVNVVPSGCNDDDSVFTANPITNLKYYLSESST